MSKVFAKVTWVAKLLFDFGLLAPCSMPLFCDNQVALHIARIAVFHERRKNIELDWHFVWTKLNEGLIHLLHTPTSSQLADVFTKVLSGVGHHLILRKLGVLSPSNLREVVGNSSSIEHFIDEPTY
uniref:Uncharacterized protein n=1 Tax=Nicotiana tabacum TaxID=4097 RepID=A0A1S4DAL5_TOBAC|nr:PREDICTED: uncharacterized protein LOC107827797 [Nicotiana tabacum]